MNNELKQQVSEFLDNELNPEAAFGLLQKARNNPEIIAALNRYAAVSQALKNDACLFVANDFSTQVARRLEQEPAYLLRRRQLPGHRHHRKVLAAAASMAAVLVLASYNLGKHDVPDPNTARQLAQTPSTMPNEVKLADSGQTDQTPLNARIYDYLQAHNNNVYTSGEPDPRPLVQVTSYPRHQ